MGLSNANVALVMMAMRNAARRDSVATLGKQLFWPSRSFVSKLISATGLPVTVDQVFKAVGPQRDGSEFLKVLGAGHVDEIDAAEYEGASIVHDMNVPLPPEHRQRYDLVFDGGCLEHIFDTRQVLENVGALLRVGGIFVGTTSGNNQLGHGFYQFSPELFYRFFCPENGWGSTAVFLSEHQYDPPRFWFAEDPQAKGHRIEVQNRSQLYLMVVAERMAHPTALKLPQQSDYVAAWTKNAGIRDGVATSARSASAPLETGKALLRKLGAGKLRRLMPAVFSKRAIGLRQPGIHPMSVHDFANYSLRQSSFGKQPAG